MQELGRQPGLLALLAALQQLPPVLAGVGAQPEVGPQLQALRPEVAAALAEGLHCGAASVAQLVPLQRLLWLLDLPPVDRLQVLPDSCLPPRISWLETYIIQFAAEYSWMKV